MSEWKRTQFYDTHVAAGATMVDFGGWEMPIQYPEGIIAEHLIADKAFYYVYCFNDDTADE